MQLVPPTQPVDEAPRDDDEDDIVLPRPGGDGVADQPEGESAREVAEAHAGEQPAGRTRGDAFTDGLLLHTEADVISCGSNCLFVFLQR